MNENWHRWYLGGTNSESGLKFLKFRPHNPYLGKFRPKNCKLFVLTKNWHTWYQEDADSFFNIFFSEFATLNPFLGKFGPKKLKLSDFHKN